ncbi:MAG: RDD family protein [Bacteroidota bacterium]
MTGAKKQRDTAHDEATSARFLKRGLAYGADCFIAFAFFVLTQLLILVPLREFIGIPATWFHDGVHTEMYTLVTVSLPVWLYFILFEKAASGTTPGKKLLGLRVRTVAGLKRISTKQAVLRNAVKLLPWELAHLANNLPVPLMYAEAPDFRWGFVACGILMGGLMVSVVVHRQRRGLHDLAAGTRVVHS